MYKCACYILDNELQEKINSKEELKKIITDFNNLIKENDGVYMAKSQENRLYCCQALKKSEREKKLRQLYERIKRKIKEKYKFCNLYVKNLPSDFTDEKLKELFGKYGEIRSAKIVKREIESNYLVPKKEIKVFGYVCYFEAGKAQEAKQKLKDEALLINGPKLCVDYHQTKKERIEFLKLKLIKKYEKSKNNIPMYPAMMTNMRHFHSFMNQYQKMMPYTDMSREQSFSDGSQQHNSHNKMDLNARNDFFGEKLYIKISHMPQFTKHSNYFSKIVGIFLDLDDNVLEKLIKDDKYFVEQVQETIKLLTEKEKSN
jgi:RNA recognition motif-containing protein